MTKTQNHKRILILATLLLLFPFAGRAEVLVKWDTSTFSGSQKETPPIAWVGALTPGPIQRGPGFIQSNASTFFAGGMGSKFAAADVNTLADAIAKNAYLEITLAPAQGASVSIKTLSFASKRASRKGGPNMLAVRSSLDGFKSDLAKPLAAHPGTTPDGGDVVVDFAGKLNSVTKPLAIRLYYYGAGESTSKGLYSIYNHSRTGGITLEGEARGGPAKAASAPAVDNKQGVIAAAALDRDSVAAVAESTVEPEIASVPSSREVFTPRDVVTSVISHERENYHGWATVARGKNGRLHLAWSGARRWHVCPFGRLEYMVSDDGGKTWSWPRVLADSITDDRDAGILETKSGVLLASFFTSITYQVHMNDPKRSLHKVFGKEEWEANEYKRWQIAERSATQEQRKADLDAWLVRSTDGGLTWSARYRAEPGNSPHGPVSLADGRVFYAAGGMRKKAAAWVSSDDGLTWTHLSDLPMRPGEMHAVEASDGTLLVHVRDKGIKQTESKDGGKTWSPPRFVNRGHGYPAHLLKMKDGNLLLTYGVRVAPYGIRAKISRDNGASWSQEFYLTKDAHDSDHGYPSTVQLDDGSFVTIWYEVLAGARPAQLRQAKWRL